MDHAQDAPVFDLDFWSDDVILNPYPHYEKLRELGPAVWLSQNDMWAIPRYQALREALQTPEVFSSAHGVMMNDEMNTSTKGIMLCTDDPEHLALRRLFSAPLMPKALTQLKPRFVELAEERIDELMARDEFDAVAELAHFLPLAVVTELVGLDDEGRAAMLDWAAGIFNAFGPRGNERTESGMEIVRYVVDYVLTRVDRKNLVPGGWGEALFIAADKGEIPEMTARMMLIDYLSPSLDTTINATSAAIEKFAQNPDQWQKLRANPSLISGAINEAVRIESPIRAFSRYVVQDYQVGDVTLKEGDRALMLYACANRDPEKYPDPEKFDIERKNSDQLGFGTGTHTCAGMHLAKLEITVLLEALIPRVAAFAIHDAERRPHNTLRGLYRLPTQMIAA